jgi:hypothetical protein
MKTKFEEQIIQLKIRKSMFIFPVGYYFMANYITGYDQCIKDLTETSELGKFRCWLQDQKKHSFSTDVFSFILHQLAKENEELAETIFFQEIESYFTFYEV